MFGFRKRLEEKKAKNKAIAESQYWKNHALLRTCLQAMRGSCTVAPMDMHEAVVAVVNIALAEDNWTTAAELIDIPGNLLGPTVYLVWDDEKLPVLKAPWVLVEENLFDVKAVTHKTFLVSETMDRILLIDEQSGIKIYSIA